MELTFFLPSQLLEVLAHCRLRPLSWGHAAHRVPRPTRLHSSGPFARSRDVVCAPRGSRSSAQDCSFLLRLPIAPNPEHWQEPKFLACDRFWLARKPSQAAASRQSSRSQVIHMSYCHTPPGTSLVHPCCGFTPDCGIHAEHSGSVF